ncbi:MAG TPA: alpha/beta hydrolase [Burkholderiales bacterium]|nr:alpha/beta hydrolase [Burkholderiales bacterium]
MHRVLKAAALYFIAVFGASFVLGTLRVLCLEPQIGARAAELLETPLMLAVMIIVARAVVRRLALVPELRVRLGMGLIALAMMLAAEFGLVLWLRGISLPHYFANLDPVTAAAYYGALGVFAAVPLFVPPVIARAQRAALVSGLVVIIIMSGVIYARYRLDLGVERERVAVGSAIAQTACGPIEYASLGQGRPVLLVHGAGGGYDQLLDMARELAGAGFRVVAPSRFGYLRTPLPADASPAAQADAHACLLDALGIDRAAVIGVSAGAPSSMQFALRHPDRTSRLVLLVPLAYAPREAVRLSPAVALMLERAVTSDFLYWAAMTLDPDFVVGTVLGTPPEVLAKADVDDRVRVRAMMRHILPVSLRKQGLLNEAKTAASLGRYDLERISAPTLLVSVKDDRYGTYAAARYTAEHVPGARFVGYRTGGHMLVGHEAVIMAQVSAFLGASAGSGIAQ